ncbi:MAG: hypothetical protein ACOYK1_02640 [Vampirovibrionia bacterium]
MTTIIRGLRGILGSNEKISAPEGTTEGVTVELGPAKQPALAASQDTIDKALAILNLGSDGNIKADLRTRFINGLKDSLADDGKLQKALVKDFGTQANNKRPLQIAIDILDLGIPFSVLSLSGNSNQSLRKHLSSSRVTTQLPQGLWAKISDQSLKIILGHANTVINTELNAIGKQSNGIMIEDLNLFEKEMDSLEGRINSSNKGQAANPKKVLIYANALAAIAVGIAAVDLTGAWDIIPGVGPNKRVPPPPSEQVVTNDVMKKINSFPGKDISRESQSTIQDRIDTNLNKLPPTFSMRPTAYVEDTKKPVSASSGKFVVGVEVEAQVGTNPIRIVYQESTSGTQITIMPEQNKGGDIRVQIIKVPAGEKPTVEEHKQVGN